MATSRFTKLYALLLVLCAAALACTSKGVNEQQAPEKIAQFATPVGDAAGAGGWNGTYPYNLCPFGLCTLGLYGESVMTCEGGVACWGYNDGEGGVVVIKPGQDLAPGDAGGSTTQILVQITGTDSGVLPILWGASDLQFASVDDPELSQVAAVDGGGQNMLFAPQACTNNGGSGNAVVLVGASCTGGNNAGLAIADTTYGPTWLMGYGAVTGYYPGIWAEAKYVDGGAGVVPNGTNYSFAGTTANTWVNAPYSGGSVAIDIADSYALLITGTQITSYVPTFQFWGSALGTATPTFTETATSTGNGANMLFAPQASTHADAGGGSFVVQLATPIGAGPQSDFVIQITDGGTPAIIAILGPGTDGHGVGNLWLGSNLDGGNQLVLNSTNDTPDSGHTSLNGAIDLQLDINLNKALWIEGTGTTGFVETFEQNLEFVSTVSPTITQLPTASGNGANMLFAPQTSTAADAGGGSFIVQLPPPTGGGPYAAFQVLQGNDGGIYITDGGLYSDSGWPVFQVMPTTSSAAGFCLAGTGNEQNCTQSMMSMWTDRGNGVLALQSNSGCCGDDSISFSTSGYLGGVWYYNQLLMYFTDLVGFEPESFPSQIVNLAPTSSYQTQPLTIAGGDAFQSSSSTLADGGTLYLCGGAASVNGSKGLKGSVLSGLGGGFSGGANDCKNEVMFQEAEVALGSRVLCLAQLGTGCTVTNVPNGDGLIWVGKAHTAPTTAPTGGFECWSDPTSGAMTCMNPGGSPFAVGGSAGDGGALPLINDVVGTPGGSSIFTTVQQVTGDAGYVYFLATAGTVAWEPDASVNLEQLPTTVSVGANFEISPQPSTHVDGGGGSFVVNLAQPVGGGPEAQFIVQRANDGGTVAAFVGSNDNSGGSLCLGYQGPCSQGQAQIYHDNNTVNGGTFIADPSSFSNRRIVFSMGGVYETFFEPTSIVTYAGSFGWAGLTTSGVTPSISQAVGAATGNGQNITIAPQPPVADGGGGSLTVTLAAPVGVGGTEPMFELDRGDGGVFSDAAMVKAGSLPGSPGTGALWLFNPTSSSYVPSATNFNVAASSFNNLILNGNGAISFLLGGVPQEGAMYLIGSGHSSYVRMDVPHLYFNVEGWGDVPTIQPVNAYAGGIPASPLYINGGGANSASAPSCTTTTCNGQPVVILGGNASTNESYGLQAGVSLGLGQSLSEINIQSTEVQIGSRVVCLNQLGTGCTTSDIPNGDGLVWIGDTQTAPTTCSSTGAELWAESGVLWACSGGSPFQVPTSTGGGGGITGLYNDVVVPGPTSGNVSATVVALSGSAGVVAVNASELLWSGGTVPLLQGPGTATFSIQSGGTLNLLAGTGYDAVLGTGSGAGHVQLSIGSTAQVDISTSSVTVLPATFQFAATTALPTITQPTESGSSGNNLYILAQSGSGTFSSGGSLILSPGTPGGSGATSGEVLLHSSDNYALLSTESLVKKVWQEYGQRVNVNVQSGTGYVIQTTDYLVECTNASSCKFTLPSVRSTGDAYSLWTMNRGTIDLLGAGSDTINGGGTSLTLSSIAHEYKAVWDGTTWLVAVN